MSVFYKNKLFKRIIVILCLVATFTMSVKPVKTNAVGLVDDLVILALGALALGTGVVSLSHYQTLDLGERVFGEFSILGGTKESLFNKGMDGLTTGIKITHTLIKATNLAVEKLPSIDTIFKLSVPSVSASGFYNNSVSISVPSFSVEQYEAKTTVQLMEMTNGDQTSAYISIYSGSGYINYNLSALIPFETIKIRAYLSKDGNGQYSRRVIAGGKNNYRDIYSSTTSALPTPKIFDFLNNFSGAIGLTTLPYGDVSVKEGATQDKLPIALPGVIGGSTGVMDFPLEGDLPLEYPLDWDKVKDKVKDGAIDVPIDPPVDVPLDPPTDLPIDLPSLDFSPLYVSFKDKFPFSIPFDFVKVIGLLNAPPVPPVFKIDFSGFAPKTAKGDLNINLDLTLFDKLFAIVRTFILLSYIVFLILKTRDFIGG